MSTKDEKNHGKEKLFWIQSFLALSMLIVTIWGVKINIESKKVSQQQLQLIRKQEEWAKMERERKPNLYLVPRDIEKELPDRVKLRFNLYNTGNKIAEKVQIRIPFSKKDEPKGERMMKFTEDEETVVLKFSLYNINQRIVYYQNIGDYFLKLPFILSFRISEEKVSQDSIKLSYAIDQSEGSETKILKFKNPYTK